MAEDTDLEAEIVAASRRTVVCGVCDWLEVRDDAAQWDRFLAGPTKTYGHRAIHIAMQRRGYLAASSKPIEAHRSRGHRVGPT